MLTHRSREDAARIRRLVTAIVLLLLSATAIGVFVLSDDSEGALGTYTGGTNSSTMSNPYAGINTDDAISGTFYVLRGGSIDIDVTEHVSMGFVTPTTADLSLDSTYMRITGTLEENATLTYYDGGRGTSIELIVSDGGEWYTGGTPDRFSDDPYVGIDAPLAVPDRPIFLCEGAEVNFTGDASGVSYSSVSGTGLTANSSGITGTLTVTGLLDIYLSGEGYIQIWIGPIESWVTGVKAVSDITMDIDANERDVSVYVNNYLSSSSNSPSVRTLYSEVVSGNSVTTRDVDSAALAMTHVHVQPVSLGTSTIRVTAEDGSGYYQEFDVTVAESQDGTLTYVYGPGTGGPAMDEDSTFDGEFFYWISETEPTRDGYIFMGWSETEGATVAQYTYDDRLNSAGEETDSRFYTYDANDYLYAVWEKEPVTHTTRLLFEENGGSTVSDLSDSFSSTETGPFDSVPFTLPADPTREGYTFDGWALSATGTATYGHVKGNTTIYVDVDTDLILYAKWTVKTMTASLMSDSSTLWTSLSCDYGSSVTIPESVPTMAKYTCIGWSTSVDATVADSRYSIGSSVTLTSDVTLYAVWDLNPQNYQLRFNLMSGSHDDYVDGQYVLSVDVKALNHVFTITAPEPSKEGYEFMGWATSFASDATVEYVTGDQFDMQGRSGAMLYAVYERYVTYTLDFDANGGTGAPDAVTGQSVTGTCALTIPDATMFWKKHDFLGWATTPDATGPGYIAGESVSVTAAANPLTLYAVWVDAPTHFTLVYDLHGGSIPGYDDSENPGMRVTVVDSMEVTHTFTVEDVGPERVGYEFLGWASTADAAVPDVEVGDPLTVDADTVVVTIHAVWYELERFTITLDANGGTGGVAQAVGYADGTECDVILPADVPTMSDSTGQYLFEGWSATKYQKNEGSAEYTVGSTVHMTSPTMTLYAVWSWIEQDVTFTVHFDVNGGTGTFADHSETVRAQSVTFTVPTTEPVNGDYDFLGWGYSKDGRAEVQPGETITLGVTETTLYAMWGVLAPYTLAFNVNGGIVNGTDSVTVDSALGYAEVVIPSEPPTFVNREYVVFLGWATDPAAVLPVYQPGDTVEVDMSKMVLYAVWGDDVFYTVSFHADGGIDPPMNIHGNSGTGSFTTDIPTDAPTREGHHFLGWSTSAISETPDYVAGQSFTTTVRDTVLYAVWGQDDVPDVTVTVDDVVVRVNGTFSTSVTVSPAGATVTVISKETWMDYADGRITGTAPALAGDHSIVLRAEADGYDPVLVTVRVTVQPNATGAETVLVTFNPNGGEFSADTILYVNVGDRVPEPSEPTREGHTFVGWTDASGVFYDFDDPVEGSVFLSAQWVEGEHVKGLSYTAIAVVLVLVGLGGYLIARRLI